MGSNTGMVMSVEFRFVALEPAVRLIFGTLQVGLYGTGRPALAYFDENGMPVLQATLSITNRSLPRDALVIRRTGPAAGFLEQLAEADHVIDLGEDINDAAGNSGRLVLPVGDLAAAIAAILDLETPATRLDPAA